MAEAINTKRVLNHHKRIILFLLHTFTLYLSNRIVYVKTPYISVISFQNANVKVLYHILYRVNHTQDASEIPNFFRKSNREQQHCDR